MTNYVNPWQRALGVASGQRSLLRRSDLRRCGLSDDQIDWRLGAGQIVSLHRGVRSVFVLAGAQWTWRQAALAACYAGPPRTRASYMTSAALQKLSDPPVLPHITVPPGSSARLHIAVVHRGTIAPEDRASVDGIPCTGAARTLVDCAAVLSRDQLANMVDTALCDGRTSVAAIEAAIARATSVRGRPGVPLLRSVLEAWAGPIRFDSPAEARLLRLLREWGYPEPERQVQITDRTGRVVARADLAWRDRRLGLEYDSRRHHNPRNWETEVPREAAVEGTGWSLVHADKSDLMPGERALRDSLARQWSMRRAA